MALALIFCRTPRPIVDTSGRIIAALAGQPSDESYAEAVSATYKAFMDASAEVRLPQGPHIRGKFPIVNFGLHYGQGQQKPQKLGLSKALSQVVSRLVALPCVQRIASYMDGEFSVLDRHQLSELVQPALHSGHLASMHTTTSV